MKKTARMLSLVLVVVMLGAILVSCSGKPSGTYGTDTYKLNFSDSKVTIATTIGSFSTSITGKFEMGKDGQGNKTITFDFSDDGNNALLSLFNGTCSYNQGKDDNGRFIEIEGVRYYKQ